MGITLCITHTGAITVITSRPPSGGAAGGEVGTIMRTAGAAADGVVSTIMRTAGAAADGVVGATVTRTAAGEMAGSMTNRKGTRIIMMTATKTRARLITVIAIMSLTRPGRITAQAPTRIAASIQTR